MHLNMSLSSFLAKENPLKEDLSSPNIVNNNKLFALTITQIAVCKTPFSILRWNIPALTFYWTRTVSLHLVKSPILCYLHDT